MHFDFSLSHILHRAQKRVDEIHKFISNYIYYRKRNHCHSMAWSMAKDTL